MVLRIEWLRARLSSYASGAAACRRRRWPHGLGATLRVAGWCTGLSLAGLLLAGCASCSTLEPSDTPFLGFWLSLWLSTLALARWLLWWLPAQEEETADEVRARAFELDAYEAAYLEGGAARALAAALASSIDCGSLRVEGTSLRTGRRVRADCHELERAVHAALASKTALPDLAAACRRQLARCRLTLRQEGLLCGENVGIWALLLSAPLLGLGEIVLGLYHDRLSLLECSLWLASVLLLPLLAGAGHARSRAGRSVLRFLRLERQALCAGEEVPALEPHTQAAWAVALFGLEVIVHWSFGELSGAWAADIMAELSDAA
ncbi:MAG: hypothetical protein JWN48_2236 [Myxococcaceae bacterium]|nr:hypothetical protein [Myxococcaceae bacterium]